MRYLVIIEKAGNNYSAHSPDLPGCMATGDTIEETKQNMKEAIELHIQGLIEDGDPLPQPNHNDTSVEWVDVA